VTVDSMKVENWTFGPNNVLTYQTDAGHSAWLQFVHLANGPIILGKFRELESEVLESEHPPSPPSLIVPLPKETRCRSHEWCTNCILWLTCCAEGIILAVSTLPGGTPVLGQVYNNA